MRCCIRKRDLPCGTSVSHANCRQSVSGNNPPRVRQGAMNEAPKRVTRIANRGRNLRPPLVVPLDVCQGDTDSFPSSKLNANQRESTRINANAVSLVLNNNFSSHISIRVSRMRRMKRELY